MEKLILKAESTGQYHFPFTTGSFYAKAIVDHSVSFDDFISETDNHYAQEFNGQRYQYTPNEMKGNWMVIEAQRIVFQAALSVADGKYKGINQALKNMLAKEHLEIIK